MINPADFYRADDADTFERSAPRGPFDDAALLRAAGADLHPGDPGALKAYWVHGKGRAKWITKPHPYTVLYHHLLKYLHKPDYAKRVAAQWFHDALGIWPGERKGKNPIGKG